ncbi:MULTISPECIES: VOC family protein [Streptomyces]|uniref:VOC family protein n=1 Tax=Streptomyces virginiae TaxID=1961 RepID=A0ABQ3NLY5_STRVG|nr:MULTISPECIES: VOC family protein [Streptomyces]KOU15406.1 3-demethylubiquinone-9 3-methyltransferase [Streptomyces sp. WM6349]KOU80599.1 3-demethylubiquinone-9 3-methyltransferase [Streptomyces sp. XY593]KOU99747.1 3-demethylubiquinone-9 3-methyltransferase [Streptomyces sp. XY533]KOV10623.1 3-demethylubiquinone-9 3-methyltransferase [Streptomyces sp. XY511]KOV42277.1 3-demethylubiquinone-9 3-methyltransferase [Streptomyces sp. H036]
MSGNGFTTCLWFDGDAEAAADYYLSVFKDGRIGRIARYTQANPEQEGSVMTVEFEVNGQRFVGLNGGPQFPFTEAISFQIDCVDEAEADYYYEALTKDGGQESDCGWVKDRFGVSWQVIPPGAVELVSDPDPGRASRAMAAMMKMKKLDVAEMRRAADAGQDTL